MEKQADITERWLNANKDLLTGDLEPLANQLRMLAATMDADMGRNGRIAPSASAAYQKCYDKLLVLRGGGPAGDAATPADDGLFGPAEV